MALDNPPPARYGLWVTPEQARALLGVEPGASPEDLDAACRRWEAAFALNPASVPPAMNRRSLARARDVLAALPPPDPALPRERSLRRLGIASLAATAVVAALLLQPQTERAPSRPPHPPREAPSDRILADLDAALEKDPPPPLPPPEIPTLTLPGSPIGAESWQAGVRAFQGGDIPGAREAWTRCLKDDPGNEDCRTGLSRIDTSRQP